MTKKLISLAISLLILFLIFRVIDFDQFLAAFATSDGGLLVVALTIVVPVTLISAWRLNLMTPPQANLGMIEASRLILAASVLNMVLPSKMGDIAKAYAIKDQGHIAGSLALSLVVFEKTTDLLALLLWCVFGLAFIVGEGLIFWVALVLVASCLTAGLALIGSSTAAALFFGLIRRFGPNKVASKVPGFQTAWEEMHRYFWTDVRRLTVVAAVSIFLWFLHLVQIWMFTVALKPVVPFVVNLALAPLSILVGLLPFTFAGVGTRDAALILFYQDYLSAEVAVALGILCTMRYVLPALLGLPFFYRYLVMLRSRGPDQPGQQTQTATKDQAE